MAVNNLLEEALAEVRGDAGGMAERRERERER